MLVEGGYPYSNYFLTTCLTLPIGAVVGVLVSSPDTFSDIINTESIEALAPAPGVGANP